MRTRRGMGRLGFAGAWLGRGLAVLIAAGPANAANLKLPDGPYSYTVIDQDLSTALQELSSNLGFKINISSEVKGRIQGRIPEGTAKDFVDHLSGDYNLEWYYDGAVLYVTTAKENRTQLLVLNPIPFDRLQSALDTLDITDARFPLRAAPGKGVVLLAGPPRYVSLVEQTLAGLVAEEQGRSKPEAKAETPSAPKLPKPGLLTVFRGSQTAVVRDGRPEAAVGSETEPNPRTKAAAN